MEKQSRSLLLHAAGAIVALSSMLLFSLQPLTIDQMHGWHSPATVVQFFQWTYLLGVLLTATSVRLSPRADVFLGAALFFPAAIYTYVTAMPDGPRRLAHLVPIAVWLSSISTVMVRSIARTVSADNLQPYSLLAASNAGALIGVLLWMQPVRPAAETSWLATASTLFIIGLSLTMLLCVSTKLPTAGSSEPAAGWRWPTYHEPLWFLLALSASFALVFAYRKLVELGEVQLSIVALPLSTTSMPLLVFLLAYVVGWLPRSTQAGKSGFPRIWHSLVIIFIAAIAAALSPAAMFLLLALYLFCAACVEALRKLAPTTALATRFQIVQAIGGACGGWIALVL